MPGQLAKKVYAGFYKPVEIFLKSY